MNKIKDRIVLIQYFVFAITIIVLIVKNTGNSLLWIMLLFAAMLYFSFFLKNVFIYPQVGWSRRTLIIFVIDFVLAYFIIYFDMGKSSIIFLYIILSDIIINLSVDLSILSVLLSLLIYLVQQRLSMQEFNLALFLNNVFQMLIQYGILSFFLYLLKYMLKQNEMIESTLQKLTAKTLEQEITLEELKEAYQRLEDITIMKERNKLAREIHDTLGHTLTTALMETEAGKILINKDKELGIEKIELAQEQIRKGLEDLRSSVALLSKGDELVSLKSSLEHFLQETIRHTGVMIKFDINLKEQLDTSIRKTLFRALQEGITNGIKHGRSTVFVFTLFQQEDYIEFLLQDNGKGCSAVIQGFGLKSMQERVKEVNGTMSIESEPEEGLSLNIRIPIIEGALQNGKDQNSSSR